MGDIVNLRNARKQKARAEKESDAAENRAKFGRSKAEKMLSHAEASRARSAFEAHKRDDQKS